MDACITKVKFVENNDDFRKLGFTKDIVRISESIDYMPYCVDRWIRSRKGEYISDYPEINLDADDINDLINDISKVIEDNSRLKELFPEAEEDEINGLMFLRELLKRIDLSDRDFYYYQWWY